MPWTGEEAGAVILFQPAQITLNLLMERKHIAVLIGVEGDYNNK